MFIMKDILNYCYAQKIASSQGAINRDLDEYQAILENFGFKVRRFEQMVHYEAAQSLVAEKENVVIKANRLLRGGEDLSIIVKHDGHETKLPLVPYNFHKTIAALIAA